MSETASAPQPTPAAAPTVPTATESTPTPIAAAAAAPQPLPVPEAPAAPAVTPTPTKTEGNLAQPLTTGESAPTATLSAAVAAASATPTIAPIATDMTPKSAPTPGPNAALPAETSAPVQEKPVEEEEPQSELTKKFTEAEWEALRKFRIDLPHVLEEAFPDNKEAKATPIMIWGITLDPSGKKDARASVVLMKFLRARNLNTTAARDMLVHTLRWRESFKIDKLMEEEFPQDVFGPLGKTFGKDKHGHPIVYNIYGGNPDIKAVFSDVERFIRWRVQFQERCITLLDFTTVDQMLQIHDYAGVSFSSRDANSKAAASEASNIFNSHYPELLYKKFFINVPSLLSWIFWAFKAVVPAATFKKMSVVGTGEREICKTLTEHVDEGQIPRRYGGGADGW